MGRKKSAIARMQHQGSIYDRRQTPDAPPAPPGRRLSPAELKAVAEQMGLGVSENRFAKETDWSRAQRALAYDQGVEQESRLKHDGVPKRFWLHKNRAKPNKRI